MPVTPDDLLAEVLEKHSLRLSSVIQYQGPKATFLLTDEVGSRYVLKASARINGLELERHFLLQIRNLNFEYIRFPKLIDFGANYLLLEFLDREHYTRETVTQRDWSLDDIRLWIHGLLEFQNIPMNSTFFSVKNRLMGIFYPVIRLILLIPGSMHLFSLKSWTSIAVIIFAYLSMRPFFRHVLTHYDLQTYNYTFMRSEPKMSILDFEISYFQGDPLFDILYFITIPINEIIRWTFQKDLLKEGLRQFREKGINLAGQLTRIRLILLVCNLSRYHYFINDSAKRMTYYNNIRFLLDRKAFRWWAFRNVLEPVCYDI